MDVLDSVTSLTPTAAAGTAVVLLLTVVAAVVKSRLEASSEKKQELQDAKAKLSEEDQRLAEAILKGDHETIRVIADDRACRRDGVRGPKNRPEAG